MTKLLLASLRIEYETTDITLDDLCAKHNCAIEELKGSEEWNKRSNIITTAEIVNQPEHSEQKPTNQIVLTTIEDKIKEFKEKAVDAALSFINKDVRFAEVKEFKDMVAIVDSIDKSLQKGTDSGPTVNILIQNLTERYQDDC